MTRRTNELDELSKLFQSLIDEEKIWLQTNAEEKLAFLGNIDTDIRSNYSYEDIVKEFGEDVSKIVIMDFTENQHE